MGKKGKERRNPDVIAQASKSETKSGAGKPKNDLYSQIFADTTDDDEPISKEKVHSQSPNAKGGKKKTSQSNLTLQQQPVQNLKLKLAHTSEEVVHKNASSKTINSKDSKGSHIVTRNLKQAESESSESEEDELVYDDGEDDDEEEDNMDVDEDKGEGKESESNEQDDEEVEESDEDELEDGDTKTPLRNQLKDLSFIELEALKQKMGLKEYNEAMFGNKESKKQSKKKRFERKNKNRPLEVSSKRRVPKFREVVKVPKKVHKDPRFDNACGEYSETFWNTEYNFLRDLQKTEAEHLRANLKKVDDNDKKREIRKFIQKVSDKEKAIVVKEKEAQKRLQHKEENKKRLEEGKRPFYVKKSTQKFLELVEKYDELKSSGGLEKYLKKKRKKNAVRDRKSLKPFK
ncbi:unnamed protein product [Orchesella dallaii]|uniref:rRNA biogenesis protein RRP36 n=1 Tax=Orchesella dallaii TaxID=48710 RepID=A0ABP1RTZ8_9HEXA